MQPGKNLYLLPFYFFLLAPLISCGNIAHSISGINRLLGMNVTNIRDLKPQDNQVTVYLQGKVTHLVPLLKQRVYQLQDSTGKIWVLTNQSVVQQGDEVLLKGKVRYQSIPLAGKDFGEVYLEETQQLQRRPER